MKSMRRNWEVEIYGDAALDEGNQQGQYTIVREPGTTKINTIGWKSRMSERKAWSSLAAEAQALRAALDKAIHWQSLRREMDLPIRKITVLTDNVSLRRLVHSGRPTQEQSLRRDVAIIRDMIIYNQIKVRFVKSEVMLADHLTKERNGKQLYDVLKLNSFEEIDSHDTGDISESMIRDAAIDIPLLDHERVLTVEVEAINEQIANLQQQSSENEENPQSSRVQICGRKATGAERQDGREME